MYMRVDVVQGRGDDCYGCSSTRLLLRTPVDSNVGARGLLGVSVVARADKDKALVMLWQGGRGPAENVPLRSREMLARVACRLQV